MNNKRYKWYYIVMIVSAICLVTGFVLGQSPTTSSVTIWDDPEYSVRCYIANDIGISCVSLDSGEEEETELQ